MRQARILLSLLTAILLPGLVSVIRSQQPAPSPAPPHTEQMVPMRDGTKLATDVYLPSGAGPFPVVLTRTPYGKGNMPAGAWVSQGYAFVSQDVRGKFKSEGIYRPFLDDANDGHDTVEWIARQPWSTGKVGMFGVSAMGIAANQAAMTAPPHLTAVFVMLARASVYSQSAFMGGVYRSELNDEWLKREHAESIITEQLKHNVYDHFFDDEEMSRHWGEVRVPAYNYGGWYDIFNQGNIDDFTGLQASGGGLAAGNQKLMMGPWGHGKLEEVKYPQNSTINPTGEALRWFDYWLKGVNNHIMEEPPVKYYAMGDVTDPHAPGNEWETALSWPPPSRTTSYFLRAGGGLSLTMPSGSDGGDDKAASKDSYQYDPKNPVPTIGGGNLFAKKGPMDQRETGPRKDVLKYQTAPLDSPVEIAGRVRVELYGESDCPDTDFMAKLVDVYPDGTERLVLDSAIRARFHDGFDHEAFLKSGQVYKFNLDLWSTSLVFNKGHRIAIQVTSSNAPRFDPNPNTGKPPRASDETRVATNSIHHDIVYPSRVLLPVVPLENGKHP